MIIKWKNKIEKTVQKCPKGGRRVNTMWSHPDAKHLTHCSVLFTSPLCESSIIWNNEDQAKAKTHLTVRSLQYSEADAWATSVSLSLCEEATALLWAHSRRSWLNSLKVQTHCCKSDWVWSDRTQRKKQSNVTKQWRTDVNDFMFILYLNDFMCWSSPDDGRRIFDHLRLNLPLSRVPSMDFYWADFHTSHERRCSIRTCDFKPTDQTARFCFSFVKSTARASFPDWFPCVSGVISLVLASNSNLMTKGVILSFFLPNILI